jgi:hypothetical protein
MIDIHETEIVAVRRTGDGEHVALFTNTGVPPFWCQRFWTVVLDTGGDALGLPVRYGTACTAPSGWTLRQLICVVQARLALEHARAPHSGALAVLEALAQAVRHMQMGEPLGSGVDFAEGSVASPYAWTVARCGDLSLVLCPDPASREVGVAPEQMLIVVDEALRDWSGRAPYIRRLWACRNAIRAAIAAEIMRVRIARGQAAAA